jgi:lipid-A-disaccharide synthase
MLQAAEGILQRVAVRFLMVLPNESLSREAASLIPEHLMVARQVGGLAEALQQATMAMASSGTVTLECAFFRVPTVVLYRVAWPTYWLGRLFVHVDHIAMPNLLAKEAVFPEFIQQSANPVQLAQASLELLEHPERRRKIQVKLDQVIASLGEGGASHRAANALLDFLQVRVSARL